MKKIILQRTLLNILIVWGFISILILAGEDIPGQPMSDAQFFLSKLAGLISLCLCVLAGKHLKRKGLLPETNESEEDDRRIEP